MRRKTIRERPASRSELAGWYAEVLEQQATSGLSVTDYAAVAGVSAWTLYQWRRRLAPVAPAGRKCDRATTPRLIEVSIARPPARSTVSDLVVRVCEGRRSIAVPCGFNDEDLRRLVLVLESC